MLTAGKRCGRQPDDMGADCRARDDEGFVQSALTFVRTLFGKADNSGQLFAALHKHRRAARSRLKPICIRVVACELAPSVRIFMVRNGPLNFHVTWRVRLFLV
jgi:hypothetical protein